MSHHDRVLRGTAISMYPRAARPLLHGPLLLSLEEGDSKDKEKASWLQRIFNRLLDSKRKLLSLGKTWVMYCNSLLGPVHKQRQVLTSHYRELSSHTRERILFLVSTLVGTALFLALFEFLYIITLYHLEQVDAAFVLSYTGAYLVSIVWQHALNRYLVFPSGSYCVSLLHTYLIYSLSYAVVATLGTLLLKMTTIHPRTVTALTLPLSGAINYYFLSTCLETSNRPVSRPKAQKCISMATQTPALSSTSAPSMSLAPSHIAPLSISIPSASRSSFSSSSLPPSTPSPPLRPANFTHLSDPSSFGPVLQSPFSSLYPFSPLLPPYSGFSFAHSPSTPSLILFPPTQAVHGPTASASVQSSHTTKDGNSIVL